VSIWEKSEGVLMLESRASLEITLETNAIVEFTITNMILCDEQERFHFEKDYKVNGEIWQVHKGDADPFPSRPHAHCVGGRDRFVGLKLHLGTRELFHGSKSKELFLGKKQFGRLIELIQPKFPEIQLPLKS
tara:strand:+ start:77 stop:472 length:396 start_codon:yes stop_codon:yes gene_type:complete